MSGSRFPHEWVRQTWTGNPVTIINRWINTSTTPRWKCKLCGALATYPELDRTDCPVAKALSEVMES
jgi:hypothetical protein